ncbi:DegT/DnrJ/EryC1/StrS family aminotransferase [Adlercreutzia mucosicola]|uniref:DegT/DnrJ/EryC1/StrS family aminotransferase n=1 Tax=Adlercreutzia mucosicola TaxID=580026 RepID=UPI00041818E9|nr:DegT/DnrJ/EryC1/StrS family aminotransferase [Adlercreutzia mucosicola]MCR2034215.1 DegT/DnrJ/EryC1/StrS family aminotransferase [Adlercreutzia mucosicola]
MAEKMNIPFSPPDITEEEIAEVADALRSGWITTGPRVKELERQLAAYLGVPRCVCLNSQTACAEMALRVLGVGPGDEVIVPAYTYTASASVICHVGATPVMVDCAPDSFEMDYDAMGRAITARTKAVIPVDLGGVPCDYDRIFAVLEEKRSLFNPASAIQEALGRVAVCEDAAHALGSAYHGRMIGSVADFTSFSFHAVKNFTTAEGGCLTWNLPSEVPDDEVYQKVQLLSLHGQSKDALAKTKLGAWEYDVLGPWYKCNMTDIQAALGLVQLKRYEGMLERRRELIALYDSYLKPLGVEPLPHQGEGYASSGHLYICRVPGVSPDERNAIIEAMAERGVATNVHYKPLPLLTAYKDLGFDIADYPRAYARFANEVTLPLHTCLTDEQAHYVASTFADIVGGTR